MMSGLPPAYGLATAAVPGFVAAIAGKNPRIITGPTNTTGLLILAALGPFLGANGLLGADGLPALATLTLMAGTIRIVAAIAGGAVLIDFIPESVLAGFTAGAGVLIGVMQIDEALGIQGVRATGLLGELSQLLAGGVAWPAVTMTAATVIVIVLGKRVLPSFPAALIAVSAATLVAYAAGLDASCGLPVVADRAAVPVGWPASALPSLDPQLIRGFIAPAAAIALLGTMELAVSARRGGERPDMRREIVAQGAANIVGAFASAFPASASLTRSALLDLGGAKTRLAPAVAALAVVPLLIYGGRLVASLPQASLAGVLFVIAARMVDVRRLRRMWGASPVTRNLLIITFVTTLVLPLEWAVFLGVAFGVGHHLASSRTPRVQLLNPVGDRLIPIDKADAGGVVVLEISGDCHFAAAGALQALVEANLPACAEHVIIDLTHARAMRFAALLSLERLQNRITDCGGRLYLAGVPPDFIALLDGTASKLDASPYRPEPLESVRSVLDRIRAG